ncbi:hypothetical protein DMZ43_10425 [Meridianimaribacter sp. CL38]|uniref:hypothetical protein n=1 Tax=Meridianimaribacter sp. CL38 TaxID=2213021 RepID=UPI00103D28B8|nr:hypothetical protein [Meridianimaribacter sp. CL38]TBV25358.1 hypothetical protein DMZ43_10425 [Meridianimaribacter sp. CL38]
MKRILIGFWVLLFVSCANETKTFNENNIAAESVIDDLDNYLSTQEDFEYQTVASQKLQELYDLSLLLKHHPEFEVDITKQIENLSNNAVSLPNTIRQAHIENVTKVNTEILSDSVSKLHLAFDIITDRGSQKDSITAIIRSEKTTIDNAELMTTKVKFEKNN